MKSLFPRFLLIAMVMFVFTGCGLKYTIKDPVVSTFKYDKGPKQTVVLQVIDQRSVMAFHDKLGGLSHVSIELENIANPVAWLSQSLEKEFAARDVPVQVVYGDVKNPADFVLTVKKFQIVSRRMTGFSPWESYHSFRGEVTSGGKTTELRAYFFNAKMPIMIMHEIEEPCFNMPLSLLVKEIASKINTIALNYSVGNALIMDISDHAAEKAKSNNEDTCFLLYELGGSNNPDAMKSLVTFSDNDDRFIRACALSAMGTLGARDQFDFLQKKYLQYEEIDKYMALKSIGDIGTPQAMDFVRKAKSDPLYDKEMAFKYVVDLYLEQ